MQNQKSLGSLYSTSHCGSATKYNFAKASTAGGEYLGYMQKPGTYAGFLSDLNASKWYQALDLEIINSLKETISFITSASWLGLVNKEICFGPFK